MLSYDHHSSYLPQYIYQSAWLRFSKDFPSTKFFCLQQVTKAIDALVKNDFSFPQAKAVIAKLKEQWKDIKSWSVAQLQKLGKLIKDLNLEDFKFLSKEQFQVG